MPQNLHVSYFMEVGHVVPEHPTYLAQPSHENIIREVMTPFNAS